ncbi:hypothetical protein WME98_31990 [Sorangium sp. So ce296]|uniref:hypothetical protein n=1 Tax=Sorangium sp. So ce296 TaxID=3133296 RepID=UPI003F616661
MTDEERTDAEEDLEEELAWTVYAQVFALGYIYLLARALKRCDADLGVDPSAWENTMVAAEWAMMEHVNGRVQGPTTITVADVERMRRLHTMGSAALAGGERPPELYRLSLQCMESLFGSDWERAAREAVRGLRDPDQ